MNEQLDPRTRQRIQALQTYTIALEQGNIEATSAVLRAAEHDAVLERMIVELHMASLETTPSVDPGDMQLIQAILLTYTPREAPEEAQVPLNGSSPIPESSTSIDNQEPFIPEGEKAMSTTEYTHSTEQSVQYQPVHKDKKHKHAYAFLQTLAAVLTVGAIVGGFILVLALRNGATSGLTNLPTITTYKNALITVNSSDGTVYALQPGSGKVLWQYATHQEVDTMIQQNGFVYVSTSSNVGARPNYLYAFRASDGKLMWSKEYPLLTGYSTMVVDSNAIAISGGEGDGSMDVVNASDGSLLWRYIPDPNGSVLWSYPIIAEHLSVIYIRYSDGIEAFQLRTGKLLWKSQAVPTVDTIFFAKTTMYVVDVDRSAIITMNPQNGKVEKSVKLSSDDQPILDGFDNGILYVDKGPMTKNVQVCALRMSDGTQLWCSSKYLDGGGIFETPAIMNKTLYYDQGVDSMNGKVRVVALATINGNVHWQWLSTETHLYSSSDLLNVVGYNGIIYLTTHQGIFAFRSSDGHLLWHLLANKDLESFALPSVPGQTLQAPN
ncbi:MAG TPA: PQQ-binding-like beta-propeller repeat protein [Ktedonobacteraceae bacterium]|nr:PQQ-binding-like beta-propeller repeat protein [Ktedonobacteraceae bacterium]